MRQKKEESLYKPEISGLIFLLIKEAMNRIKSVQNAGPFSVAPGGVPVVVKRMMCPEIKRMTGSSVRVRTIKGVKPA